MADCGCIRNVVGLCIQVYCVRASLLQFMPSYGHVRDRQC